MPAQNSLTAAQAATRLGVHPSRIRHLIRVGRLPARKHGRDWLIDEADLAQVQNRPAGWPKGRPRQSMVPSPSQEAPQHEP